MRSRSEIEKTIKKVLKNDGYPDADSFSRTKIIKVINSCIEEIAQQTPAWSSNKNFAFQLAKMHLLEVFHLTEEEFDTYLG